MSSPDEVGIRSERVNTLDSHHSDEEISRMCKISKINFNLLFLKVMSNMELQ